MTWYVSIKLLEWMIWSGIALYFLVWGCFLKRRSFWLSLSLAVAFFVFGGADFIEYFTKGRFPAWLWAWKIAGGLTVFALLLVDDYQKRGPVALSRWRFAFAGLILILTACCIWINNKGGNP